MSCFYKGGTLFKLKGAAKELKLWNLVIFTDFGHYGSIGEGRVGVWALTGDSKKVFKYY